ncbi:MAG: LamG domain-containing protein [Candidatus Aenigmarchaeota archaeon]|nr:LamG domain-containing protein [Candidatus Aenigmarchaeota archaeon]
MDVSFLVAVSIFLLFISLILVSAINYFTRVPESATILEIRDKVKNLFNVFFGSGGIATSERLTTQLYRVPLLLDDTNGTARTNEVVALGVEHDFDCDKKTAWNSTVRVYDQQFNELPSKISYQEFCSSQWLNTSIVTFLVNTSANEKKRVYVYWINNTNTTSPKHNTALTGYWKFDEAGGILAKDSSGYQNNGTLNSFDFNASSGWYNGSSCEYGSCLKFDGRNDYVSVADTKDIRGAKADFAIAAWINPGTVSGTQRFVWKNDGNANFNGYYLSLSGASVVCGFGDGTIKVEPSGGTVSANTWYNVMCVRSSSSDFITLYVNGVNVSGAADTLASTITYAGQLELGGRSDASEFFNGTMDDARIYNKSLTTAEITSISNATLLAVTAFAQENVTAIDASKAQNLTARRYDEVRTILGGDYNFRIEISEKK